MEAGRGEPGGGRSVDSPLRAAPGWAQRLPVLHGDRLTLRELERSDALALRALAAPEVTRYVPPPPDNVDGLERFITWTRQQRETGAYVCYAVVPACENVPAGVFQIRQLEPTFKTAEWGFLFASAYWGTGLFMRSAPRVLDFIFETVGVHRLEARAAVANVRANKVLAKLGATLEGHLRRSFLLGSEYYDDALWSMLREDWPSPIR